MRMLVDVAAEEDYDEDHVVCEPSNGHSSFLFSGRGSGEWRFSGPVAPSIDTIRSDTRGEWQ